MPSSRTGHDAALLDYYSRLGLITDPLQHRDLFTDLPDDVPALCQLIRGFLIHPFELQQYASGALNARQREMKLRRVDEMLSSVREASDMPLTFVRQPRRRLMCDARGFALMLCAILRHKGVPARVRCGFSAYTSDPNTFTDHWLCEYWSVQTKGWVMVDAYLGAFQVNYFKITFDPCNVPHDQFLVAGRAWQLCRTRKEDARRFGFGRWRGLGFIRGNLLKDLVSLNKIELQPTDHLWGFDTMKSLSAEDLVHLDRIAHFTLNAGGSFDELRAAYENDPRLYIPVESTLREEGDGQKTSAQQTSEPLAASERSITLPLLQHLTGLAVAPKAQTGRTSPPLSSVVRPVEIEPDKIVIRGAQQHNLKNIDLSIPRNKLVVLTGVSGSGKSSLAFDTIYAEGQRRYVESLSPFIRHFLEKMEKPKVDYITGLSPSVAIEQKAISKNPRSTVGTVTEIFHHLRLLYSRIGTPHCLQCGSVIRPQSPREIATRLATLPTGTAFRLLAPIIRNRKGSQAELIEQIRRDGFESLRIDGEMKELSGRIKITASEPHTIEVLVAQEVVPDDGEESRRDFTTCLLTSVKRALRRGNGILIVDLGKGGEVRLSEENLCPHCGIAFPELTSQQFSFNSPFGMCSECRGLGTRLEVDLARLIDDPSLSILDGALRWFGNLRKNKRSTWPLGPLDLIAEHYGVSLEMPWQDLPQRFRDVIFYGSGNEKLLFPRPGGGEPIRRSVKGLVYEIDRLYRETETDSMRAKYGIYMSHHPCSSCGGTRLSAEARAVTIGEKTIAEVSSMSIEETLTWVRGLYDVLDREQLEIGDEIFKEVIMRLQFMMNVGLHYLMLERTAPSLSGGEGQRVRLASQLGSGLVGVLYVLDEPSIGLHARDQNSLLDTLRQLRDMGNTVLVVEHDAETMRSADWLIDLGPRAGVLGGEVVAAGPPSVVASNLDSLTGRYLSGACAVTASNRSTRRESTDKWLVLVGARLHNLKNVTARFPLGLLTCITGVSGSGKSSLIAKTLEPALVHALHSINEKAPPGPHDRLEGLEYLDKVINITQDPIGRTPRSNPATYIKVFDEIRELFAATPEARRRGYTSSNFSFNLKGGRCEACEGHGQKRIEMHFLADVWVTCKECNGMRYTPETLEVFYQSKNIAQVLDMDVQEALEFFKESPNITRVLQTLHDVGLDYIKLGQSATTLSGGEAQRVKLAKELSRVATGRTIYILDEPTTGLHFADIQQLLDVLHRLVENGNTVIVIEHNLDVIKTADWVIDMGPEGGRAGGFIIAEGTPEDVAQAGHSYTGSFLQQVLARAV